MLKAILESAVAAILAIDSSGRIQVVNPAAEKMFGYAADEMIGKPVNILMPEPYQAQHDAYLHRHLSTGEKRIIGIGREVQGLRKDGTIFPLHLSVGAFEVGGQRFFSGILNDLSARARLQAEIDRQSLLFQAVFDHVPEALVISSPDGEVILVNPAATRMFGYSAEDVVELSALFAEHNDLSRLIASDADTPNGRSASASRRHKISRPRAYRGYCRLRRITHCRGDPLPGHDRRAETEGSRSKIPAVGSHRPAERRHRSRF